MDRLRRVTFGVFVAGLCLGWTLSSAYAQFASGGSYTLEQTVIANGGGASEAAGYAVDMTLAEALAGGELAGSPYNLFSGTWHALGAETPTPTDTPTATPTDTPTATPTEHPLRLRPPRSQAMSIMRSFPRRFRMLGRRRGVDTA